MSKKSKPLADVLVDEPKAKVDIREVEAAVTAAPRAVEVLSRQESEISDLVKEQPNDIERLVIKDTSIINLLELPAECYPLHKTKYRYRWLAKDKNLSAKLSSTNWVLCTRTNSPYIKSHRFKSHGAVEQAGMLLAFMSEKMGAAREAEPAIKSRNLVKHYTEDLPNNEAGGFYKPENTGGDDEEGFEVD